MVECGQEIPSWRHAHCGSAHLPRNFLLTFPNRSDLHEARVYHNLNRISRFMLHPAEIGARRTPLDSLYRVIIHRRADERAFAARLFDAQKKNRTPPDTGSQKNKRGGMAPIGFSGRLENV
jgi:hypothetical protein